MATSSPTSAQLDLGMANLHLVSVRERVAREGVTTETFNAWCEAIDMRRAALAAAIAEERRP